MRVLALDASTEACSAALLMGEELIGRYEEPGKGHAERILRMVDAVLAEGGMRLSTLDGIAACIGPGSFTGVRITVSVAQGLAFGAGLAVVAVSSLEALALARLARGAAAVLACLDARMGEVYWGCFAAQGEALIATSPACVSAPGSIRLPETGATHGIGRGFTAYPTLGTMAGLTLDPKDRLALPNAREMARLGAWRLSAGEAKDPAALEPLYLRDKVALTEAERALR